MRDIIKKNKINEKYILNFDETPCFWEYAPKKVLAEKGKKVIPYPYANQDRKKITVGLTAAAYGVLLSPLWIEKTKIKIQKL